MKERIVGAVVLVALAVLLVPVFLDGPPGAGDVLTERVPLPGQDAARTQTVVLDRNRTEPVPASSGRTGTPVGEPPASERPAATQAAQAEPQPEPPAAEPREAAPAPVQAAPATTSATGMFAVQLGSFSSRENAEKLAADLRKQGYAAFLSQLSTADGSLQRVRIGPLADRDAAEKMAARLAGAGYEGQVVPHP